MSNKKNIDRLFQEKFKDFERFPDPIVWKNIEKQLQKKRKRRIIPLWFKIGSAAAILLAMVSTGLWYFDTDNITTDPGEIIITKSDAEDVSDDKNDNLVSPKEIAPIQTGIANQNTKETTRSNADESSEDKSGLTNSIKAKQVLEKSLEFKKDSEVIAANKLAKEQISAPEKGTVEQVKDNLLKNEETVATSEKTENKAKKDLLEELNKLNKPKETELIADEINAKWSIGSSVSPLYYNSLSNGSPIDDALASNGKSDDGSLSFGLKVNYKVSKKLSLQSGINSVKLGYSTENVTALISSSLLDGSSSNINTNVDGVSVAAISTAASGETSAAFSQRATNDLSGNLDQTFNYIEIPIEAKYNVSQKKLGINVVGGFSTYFLRKNEVSITSFGKTTTLGEASNLNTTNFSGNLGLDLDYNIGKNLFISVSPMFKYQFNTFSENSGGFQPYYFGVYTGLNFRF